MSANSTIGMQAQAMQVLIDKDAAFLLQRAKTLRPSEADFMRAQMKEILRTLRFLEFHREEFITFLKSKGE